MTVRTDSSSPQHKKAAGMVIKLTLPRFLLQLVFFGVVFFRVRLVTVVFLVLLGLKVVLETPDVQESLASPEPE